MSGGFLKGIGTDIANVYNAFAGQRLANEKFAEEKKQFGEMMAYSRDKFGVDTAEQNRQTDMSGIQMLASQRANAIKSFRNNRFKTDLLKILG